MRNVILREPPKRQITVDTPLQTFLTMALGAAIVIGLALGSVVLHAIVSQQIIQ